MAGKSDYLEKKVLDHILGNAAYTAPATVYVALFTSAPSDSGGGTELSGSGYTRVAVTNNATNFPAATGTNPSEKSNGTDIEWSVALADWGVLEAWGIFDAASSGNLLYWGLVTPTKLIESGRQARFAVGQLIIYED